MNPENQGVSPQPNVPNPTVRPEGVVNVPANTDIPPTPEVTQSVNPIATPVVSEIADRLANQKPPETIEESSKPIANTPMMIDLANLSPEQLSTLKSMLSVTPDRVQQKRGNIRIEIRKVSVNDVDRYIVDFKRSRMALQYHAETGKEMETHIIPVLFDGETDYVDMNYTEFMQSDRVAVEVIGQRSEENIIDEGQVVQRETGKLVTKEVKIVDYFYTVSLPNGKNVELQGKMANA